MAKRRAVSRRVVDRDPDPLRDERDAHDDVAADGEREVALIEDPRHPGRQHQGTGHDDQHAQAVDDIVGVVGRCEPGEVHPREPDCDEHVRIAHERGGADALDDRMVEPFGRQGDRDNHDEVEEQLERRRGPALLRRIASAHRRGEVRMDRAPQRSLAHCASLCIQDSDRSLVETGLTGPSIAASVRVQGVFSKARARG